MKRTGCFLLSVLMLLLVMVIVVGAEKPPLVLSAENVEGEAGETVTVAVQITSNPGITSLKLSLSYDETALKLIEGENQTLLSGWYQASPTADTLPYLMVWVASDAQTAQGTLILLKFQIAEGVTVGTVLSPVLSVEEAYSNSETVLSNAVSFSITVTCEHTYGLYSKVDDNVHRYECTKCHTAGTAAHQWNAGAIPSNLRIWRLAQKPILAKIVQRPERKKSPKPLLTNTQSGQSTMAISTNASVRAVISNTHPTRGIAER